MTDKAYIVANEEQERDVLGELNARGYKWQSGSSIKNFTPSVDFGFPIKIIKRKNKNLAYEKTPFEDDEIIVYDGRKESKMKISKEVYDAVVEWKNNLLSSKRIYQTDIDDLYSENVIRYWWHGDGGGTDANNRLITIIRWVNGEDVFEVEKPKKWVVRSKDKDEDGDRWYVELYAGKLANHAFREKSATKFDTKEEAKSWANAHQEVIEVEE